MLDVVRYPNPELTRTCLPVTVFGPALVAFVEQMTEVMYSKGGIGLAAPQVGSHQCITLIDLSAGDATDQLMVLVNPRVTWRSPEVEVLDEGCLSLPGVKLPVVRPWAIELEYFDSSGVFCEFSAVGLTARIIQHEVDHLNGTLVLDRVSSLVKRLSLKGYEMGE